MEPSNELKIAMVKLFGSGKAAQEWWTSWNYQLKGRPDILYKDKKDLVEGYIYQRCAKLGILI